MPDVNPGRGDAIREISSFRGVDAADDNIAFGNPMNGFGRIQIHLQRQHRLAASECIDHPLSYQDLRDLTRRIVGGGIENPVQVLPLNDVGIDQHEFSDAETRKLLNHDAAGARTANHRNTEAARSETVPPPKAC